MKKTHDCAVATGSKYTVNGQEKNRYENVGGILSDEDTGRITVMLKATFNPAGIPRKEGSDYIFINCYPVKPKDNNSQAFKPLDGDNSDSFGLDSGIPF